MKSRKGDEDYMVLRHCDGIVSIPPFGESAVRESTGQGRMDWQ